MKTKRVGMGFKVSELMLHGVRPYMGQSLREAESPWKPKVNVRYSRGNGSPQP